MEQLWEEVLLHLEYTGIGMALFIVCYVSNICFSVWYNVKILGQTFDWKKIWDSVLKIFSFGLGTALMCVGITTIPIFCTYIGLEIPAEYSEVFEKLAIISVFIYSACKYLLEAYDKFKKILNNEKSETTE